MKILNKILICFFILLPMTFATIEVKIDNGKLKTETIKLIPLFVTATTYTVAKNNSIPSFTKSGFKINQDNPRIHKIIAISRDLLDRFEFGEKVLIEGIGKYSGVYVIRDLMAERWKKRIDILRNPDDNLRTYKHVRMSKLE